MNYSGLSIKPLILIILSLNKALEGGYPDSNRERTVPHTVALPIELHPPISLFIYHTKARILCIYNYIIRLREKGIFGFKIQSMSTAEQQKVLNHEY